MTKNPISTVKEAVVLTFLSRAMRVTLKAGVRKLSRQQQTSTMAVSTVRFNSLSISLPLFTKQQCKQ